MSGISGDSSLSEETSTHSGAENIGFVRTNDANETG